MAKEMTLREAKRIIQETYAFGPEFDVAVNFLQEHEPDSDVLRFLQNNDIETVRKSRAKAYVQKALLEDEYDAQFDDAMEVLKGDKKIEKEVAEEQAIYDRANNLNISDEEAVLRNTLKIDEILGSVDVEKMRQDKEFDDITKTIDRIDVIKDNSEKATKDESEQYWNIVVETAKQKVVMLRAGDKDFFFQKEEEKRKTLFTDIRNFLADTITRGVVFSAKKEPTEAEMKVGSAEYKAYIKDQNKKAEKALKSLINTKKRVAIKSKFFLDESVDTFRKMSSYTARWFQKGFKRVGEVFKQKTKNFNGMMKKFWGKSYEVRKNVVEYAKNNKWRLGVDTLATGVVGLTATGGMALPVLAGYALYSAAGSWAWPLIEKKTKGLREAKKQGGDVSAWKGMAGIKKAYAEVKADNKEYKKYKNRAYTGTAFGLAGACIVGSMGASATWVADKAGALTAKVTSSVVRTAGSITNQALNYRNAKKDYMENPSDENLASLKGAKTGLVIGGVVGFLSNYISFERLSASNGAGGAGILAKIKGWFGREDIPSGTPSGATEVASGAEKVGGEAVNGAQGGGKAVSNAVTSAIEENQVVVPTKYDVSMGISEDQWNRMQNDMNGIYENHANIFGMENVDKEFAWENMYENLAQMEKKYPELFEDTTKEQFLFKYMMVMEQTERAKYVTNMVDGEAVKMLVTKLDKDGLPTYGPITEVMRSLNNNILGCKDAEIDVNAVKEVMANVSESGKYVGPGHDVGITTNYFLGARTQCGDQYQNAWAVGDKVQSAPKPEPIVVEPKPEVVPEPQPEPEQKPEVKPEPKSVKDVVVNEEVTPSKPKVSDVVKNEPVASPTVIIHEGATDGNLDANNPKLESRRSSFIVAAQNGNGGKGR